MSRQVILVADSHHDCRETMAEVLRMDGHQVRTALDCAGVLRSLASREIDMLLLDSRLDGCDAGAFARTREASAARRIVIMATYLSQTRSSIFLHVGQRVHVLPKPVDLNVLRGLLGERAGPVAA